MKGIWFLFGLIVTGGFVWFFTQPFRDPAFTFTFGEWLWVELVIAVIGYVGISFLKTSLGDFSPISDIVIYVCVAIGLIVCSLLGRDFSNSAGKAASVCSGNIISDAAYFNNSNNLIFGHEIGQVLKKKSRSLTIE